MRNEMNPDERKRAIKRAIDAYGEQVNQEQIARANSDNRHLRACLDAQEKILGRLRKFGVTGFAKTGAEPAPQHRSAAQPAATATPVSRTKSAPTGILSLGGSSAMNQVSGSYIPSFFQHGVLC